MKIFDSIVDWYNRRRGNVLFSNIGEFYGGLNITKYPFAKLIYCNICGIMTDLLNDVTLIRENGDTMVFAYYKTFVESWGIYMLTRLYDYGFVVVARDKTSNLFSILKQGEYSIRTTESGETIITPNNHLLDIYVLRSQTFKIYGISDRQMCEPAMKMLDAVLNGTTTISERLGAFVIGTPSTPSGSPMAGVFNEEQKKKLEKEVSDKYGALSSQSQVMILPNDMKFQAINLAGLDIKMTEKAKMAILMICDRIGVPANQVAIIDSNSNKTLANGSELREGDFNKYQAFERMLNETIVAMAAYYGLGVNYTIYNKPIRKTTISE